MDLTGTYTNELKSVMILRHDADDNLTGTYHSLVGRDIGLRQLQGRTAKADGSWQMTAFTVCFEITDAERGVFHSICAWDGWSKKSSSAILIETHWLLTTAPKSDKDEWSSHLIGEDEFLRIGDAPDQNKERDFLRDMDSIKVLYQKTLAR